ncbi:MAG: hypothetical protein U0T79_11165 [Ferruginibacter sp.]
MKLQVVYIKLGSGNEWADECLKKGILRIGFREISKDLFETEDLDRIWYKYVELGYPKRAADMYWSQLNTFFEAKESVIWITFHQQKMWWCKTKKGYKFADDNTKFKEVIGAWSDKDINGKKLWEDNLSGNLTKTKAYLSTICVPDAADYAWNKIHCLQSRETIQFETDLAAFRKSTIGLIRNLTWQDFEVLVDLIFRNAGYQRMGVVGKNVKAIDLSLLHPLSNEKIFVQIKSAATLAIYDNWKSKILVRDSDETQYYFAVHSPKKDLQDYEETRPDKFKLWREKEISEMVIRFGLIDWLVQKVG